MANSPYNGGMSSRLKSAARITRRQWNTLLAVSPLLAQVPDSSPPKAAPETAPAPAATPEARAAKAASDVRSNSDRLSKFEIPADVEPAFSFRP